MGQYLGNWVVLPDGDVVDGARLIAEQIGNTDLNWAIRKHHGGFYMIEPTAQLYSRMTDVDDIWSKVDPYEHLTKHVIDLIDETLPALAINNAQVYDRIVKSYTSWAKTVIEKANRSVQFHKIVKV